MTIITLLATLELQMLVNIKIAYFNGKQTGRTQNVSFLTPPGVQLNFAKTYLENM